MIELVPATGPILEHILDESFDLWGEGLSRKGYGQYNLAQARTPWGAANLRRLALVENGRVLSSAKRYDFDARLDGRFVRVIGIGAVFTPPAQRRRGLARQIVEMMVAQARDEGADLALLFSDIGPAFYAALGFVAIRLEEATIAVTPMRGAPGVLLRAGDDRDVAAVAHLHNTRAARFRFALERTREQVSYSLAKKRLLSGLAAPGNRSTEFFVVEEGAGAVAHTIVTVAGDDWMLEECGDRDPSGARVGAALQMLLARDTVVRPNRIRAWLPRGFVPPQIAIVDRRPAPELMMITSLRDRAIDPPLEPADVLYWHGDVF